MRAILEQHLGMRVYLFTTQGHVHAGTLSQLLEDVVDLVAPDGVTHIYINLTDVSGARAYDEEIERAP
jgi:hypothetical protein